MNKLLESFKHVDRKIIVSWLGYSHLLFMLVAIAFVLYPVKGRVETNNKYNIYASKPLVLNESTFEIATTDARAQKIDGIYSYYKCPLEGFGNIIVREADKNNIPWYIVAAISFQESTCGKAIPYVDGEPSYNAWGYAVYGGNVHTFDNWVEGIEVMSRYLKKRFYSQGITDTSEIMQTYTPPSLGSWYKGVDYFSDLIQNYSTN